MVLARPARFTLSIDRKIAKSLGLTSRIASASR
jgi:hypothetical protein